MYFWGPETLICHLGWDTPLLHTLVYMSAGVSRDQKSSHRIKLSKLVQELFNFYSFGTPRMVGVSVCGGAPTCMHIHAKKYMLRNGKWLATCLSCLGSCQITKY